MQKKLLYGISALALGAALVASAPSFAQGWGHGGGGGGSPHASGGSPHGSGPSGAGPSFRGGARFGAPVPARAFAGHSVSHFSAANLHTWSGGHWSHGNHHGHSGWWWNTGGGWFFYPYAVYPYPTYVSPDAYYDDEYYGPSDGYNGGGGGSWYYCDNPQGYYPYVQSCNGPWRPVAPTPPNMQQGDNGYQQGGPPPGYGNDGGPPNGAPDNGPPDNGPPNDGGPDNGPPPPPPPGH